MVSLLLIDSKNKWKRDNKRCYTPSATREYPHVRCVACMTHRKVHKDYKQMGSINGRVSELLTCRVSNFCV